MKQIEDLQDIEIDQIISIMLGKERCNNIISRTDDRKYIIAEYKRERDIVRSDKYDYVKMYITIDEQFQIHNRWGYVNETPEKGPLGEGISSEPLYRYQYITKYLLEQGYDIYQEEKKND